MAVAWRSVAHTAYGGGEASSITIAKPSGLAVDDILVLVLHREIGATEAPTASGFTVEAEQAGSVAGGGPLDLAVMWKRATSGDVAATDFTFNWSTNCWRTADLHAFSGATTSGNPFTGSSIQIGNNTATIPSLNYTAGNGLGIWAYTLYFDNATITPPGGYTQRSYIGDGSLTLATRNDTAGATSTGTGSTDNPDTDFIFAATLLEPSAAGVIPVGWIGM